MTGPCDTKWQHILTPELEAELELRWRVRGKLHLCLADLDHENVNWDEIAHVLRSALDAIEAEAAA